MQSACVLGQIGFLINCSRKNLWADNYPHLKCKAAKRPESNKASNALQIQETCKSSTTALYENYLASCFLRARKHLRSRKEPLFGLWMLAVSWPSGKDLSRIVENHAWKHLIKAYIRHIMAERHQRPVAFRSNCTLSNCWAMMSKTLPLYFRKVHGKEWPQCYDIFPAILLWRRA